MRLAGGERVQVRAIDDEEGPRLSSVVRRGSRSVVPWRRAQMILLAAQWMPVPKIAQVTFTSEDLVAWCRVSAPRRGSATRIERLAEIRRPPCLWITEDRCRGPRSAAPGRSSLRAERQAAAIPASGAGVDDQHQRGGPSEANHSGHCRPPGAVGSSRPRALGASRGDRARSHRAEWRFIRSSI
ncbi:hypothetical protein FRAAL4673 [Frankia alni ACN14a]|uniref:Transposase n=1 Tax=Frankia alni (strain DSM 45986 / CECT 9034 / ACN14a) TaxID=326424 RepID=Q0RGS1_FRAAA|nr:hypothetical protein FRAAL4673 [Frankia alni ACN14a]